MSLINVFKKIIDIYFDKKEFIKKKTKFLRDLEYHFTKTYFRRFKNLNY